MILAGFPATIAFGGTSRVTTAPAGGVALDVHPHVSHGRHAPVRCGYKFAIIIEEGIVTKRLVVRFAAVVLGLSQCAVAAAQTSHNWVVAYEHDASGQSVSGSLSALIDAVQAGADVKVAVHLEIQGSATTHVFYPQIAGVAVSSTGSYVYAMARLQSAYFDQNGLVQFYQDWLESNTFRTDGVRNTIAHSIATGALTYNQTQSVGMTWFVNR